MRLQSGVVSENIHWVASFVTLVTFSTVYVQVTINNKLTVRLLVNLLEFTVAAPSVSNDYANKLIQ